MEKKFTKNSGATRIEDARRSDLEKEDSFDVLAKDEARCTLPPKSNQHSLK